MALMRVLLLVIAVLFLAVPVELPGCGGGPSPALFLLKRQPEDPEQFALGNLGVPQPAYARRYLVIAYRHLIGAGLNEKERAAICVPPEPSGDFSAWSAVRNQVSIPAGKPIVTNRPLTSAGYFAFALNCGTDAFRTAAATLADRSQEFGATNSVFYDWVRAQDIVFSNCGEGDFVPGPAGRSPSACRSRISDCGSQVLCAEFRAGWEPISSGFRRTRSRRGGEVRVTSPPGVSSGATS